MNHYLILSATAVTFLFSTTPIVAQTPETSDPGPDRPIELETVVVTPFLRPRSADDFGQPISQVDGDRLLRQTQSTLGETLNSTPGVSSTYYGPGASRPIIRGFNGDRIRVLTNGMGTFDASVISPDHAISAEPMFASRVEIIRGPATLMYGSSAIGGVVNMMDPSLPEYPPEKSVSGEIGGRYGSNNDEWVGMARASGGNDSFGWFASGLKRQTGDIQVPVAPGIQDGSGPHDETFDGTLFNSAVTTQTATAGISGFLDKSFASVAYTLYNTRYGIPGGREEEVPVQVDLKQKRVLARAGLSQPVDWLKEVNLKVSAADYEHVELEGEAIGTRFITRGADVEINAMHAEYHGFVGALGLEYETYELEAIGDEAFLPPTTTDKWSAFGVESYDLEHLTAQFGLRYENQVVDVTNGSGQSVHKDGISLSAGAVWRFTEQYSLGLSLSNSQRMPNAQELFADGPHAATRAYEIGNPDLGTETAYSADLVFRKRQGRVTGEISLFANTINHYIFEELTGATEDGLPVYQFVARAAQFIGGEIEASILLLDSDDSNLKLKAMADTVHATDTDRDQPLPRIPPVRYGVGLEAAHRGLSGGVDYTHAAGQNRTAPLETATPGYNLVSAFIDYDFNWSGTDWTLYLRGTNLFDQDARASTSYLKETVPFPGRNFVTGVRMSF